MRVYPHLQDTGGFFVAVIERKKDFEVKAEKKRSPDREGSILATSGSDDVRVAKRAKFEGGGDGNDLTPPSTINEEVLVAQDDVQVQAVADASFKENPFTFISEDDPNLVSCMCVLLVQLGDACLCINNLILEKSFTFRILSLVPTYMFGIPRAIQCGRFISSTMP